MGEPKLQQKPKEGDLPPAPAPLSPAPPAEDEGWTRPRGMGRRGWAVLAAVVVLFNVPLIHRALRPGQPVTAAVPFEDDFSDPSTVAKNYWATGGHWRVVGGELLSPGVKNNPLWLKASLPQNVAVEFDARTESPEGDLKVEIFGDGLNHQSGYVLIHGGWNNKMSIIARLDEHGAPLHQLQKRAADRAREKGLTSADLVETGVFNRQTRMRVEGQHVPVQVGRTYRWRIERRGQVLRWLIDGKLYMEFDDPFPLTGKGQDRLGFSSWEAQLFFDNLRITPL